MAQGLTEALGQRVIVENHGSNQIAVEVGSRASPDGYSIVHAGPPLWILPLFQKVSWDPVRDFSPVSLTYMAANVLVVQPSLPVKSVKELIALAKAKPGELNYGTSGSGSTNFLSAELFKYMAGIDATRINYKGGGSLITGLLRGEIQFSFSNANTSKPLISAGKVRALAITSANASDLMPDLPTVAASLPGFESINMSGIAAPAKTPVPIIERLSRELAQYVKTSDVKSKLAANGAEAVGSTPAQFSAIIKADMTRVGNLVKAANLKLEE